MTSLYKLYKSNWIPRREDASSPHERHASHQRLFDIWYVKTNSDFDFQNIDFQNLLDIKLKEAKYIYTLEEHFSNLQRQVQTDLRPVLNHDFDFNFEEIYTFVLSFKK